MSSIKTSKLTFPLTSHTDISPKKHILYTYSDIATYIENAVSFVYAGLDLGQNVVFVDSLDCYEKIKQELIHLGYGNKLHKILYKNSAEFYETSDYFHIKTVLNNFNELVEPIIKSKKPIRTWGHVAWKDQEKILDALHQYECQCCKFVEEVQSITVCAYNGQHISAHMQQELLKTHEYFMTDEEMHLSQLYKSEHTPLTEHRNLPSLVKQLEYSLKKSQQDYHLIMEKLQKSELMHNMLNNYQKEFLEQIPDAIFIGYKGKIIYLNENAANLLEDERPKIIGRKSIDYAHPKYHYIIKERIKMVQEEGTQLNKMDQKVITAKGNEIDVEVHTIPYYFEGKLTSLSVVRNITERLLHQELVIKSEKLSVTGQLAAGIAHEVRNPLTSIKGFLQLLKAGTIDIGNYYNIIDSEIKRIETIASELLVLGKPMDHAYKTLNIVPLIRDVSTLLNTQAILKNIEIKFSCEQQEVIVYCNETQLKQVFINLMKNAIEAMDNQGTIHIIGEVTDSHIELKVIDQGKGIPEEIKNKLGEPFYSTKEKGTGLGLMICYNIIGQHNGTISVESEIDQGTTFTIKLPIEVN